MTESEAKCTIQSESHIEESENINECLTCANSFLQSNVSSLQAVVSHLEDHCEDQRTNILDLQEEIDDLEDDVEYLEGELGELKQRVEKQTKWLQDVVGYMLEGREKENR